MPNYIFDKAPGPYDLPSLADSKSFKLNKKLAEKREKLTPAPYPTPEEVAAAELSLAGGANSGSNILDMIESSLYQGAGNIADTYANIQQNALGNKDYALSPEVDALSNEAHSDSLAGYTGRGAYQQNIKNLTNSVSEADSIGDYWDVAKQGFALGPEALADSAASGVELGLGALGTAGVTALAGPVAGAVTGGLLFGKKVKKAKEAAEKVVSFTDRLEKGVNAVPGMIVKSAGRTSLLTADIVEQMRQEYKEANNGQEPSAAWYGTNVPIIMALNALEFGIISKAIPKASKSFVKDMKKSMKFMPKGHVKEAAKRILSGAKKVFTTAGQEAGQEYLQTWHEILAPKVDGDTLNTLVNSAVKELNVDKNQTEAIVGSILGFSAGGTAKGIATVPTTAVAATADITAGTVKKVAKVAGKGIQKVQTAANYKLLSEKDRQAVSNLSKVKKKVYDEKVEVLDNQINIIENSETHTDMFEDEELSTVIKEYQKAGSFTDEDMNDPGRLKNLKDKLLSSYRAEKVLLRTKLETSNIAAMGKLAGKNVKDATVEAAEKTLAFAEDVIPDEVVEKAIVAAQVTKKQAAKMLKIAQDVKSSAALGVINAGLTASKDQYKTILTAARNLEVGELERSIDIIKDANPDLGKKLNTLLEQKISVLPSLGQSNDTLINQKTVSKVIKNFGSKSVSDANLASAIFESLAGKVEDNETLDQISKALEHYKKSDAYKNTDAEGRIDETNMAALEGKIEKASARINRKKNAVDKVKDVSTKAKEKVTEYSKPLKKLIKKAKLITEKFSEANNKVQLAAAAKEGPEAVKKVQAKIDKGIADAKAAQEAAHKLAKEQEITVPEETFIQKVKRNVEDINEAVKEGIDTANEVIKESKREPKVLEKGSINDLIKSISNEISNTPEAAKNYYNKTKALAKKLKLIGYESVQDIEDLSVQFPGLAKDQKLLNLLKDNFEVDEMVVEQKDTNEDIDEVVNPVTERSILSRLKNKFTGC